MYRNFQGIFLLPHHAVCTSASKLWPLTLFLHSTERSWLVQRFKSGWKSYLLMLTLSFVQRKLASQGLSSCNQCCSKQQVCIFEATYTKVGTYPSQFVELFSSRLVLQLSNLPQLIKETNWLIRLGRFHKSLLHRNCLHKLWISRCIWMD